jgi:hypothetical protein
MSCHPDHPALPLEVLEALDIEISEYDNLLSFDELKEYDAWMQHMEEMYAMEYGL